MHSAPQCPDPLRCWIHTRLTLPQGLGEELALVFASHGAHLILTARNTERLQVCFLLCQQARVSVIMMNVKFLNLTFILSFVPAPESVHDDLQSSSAEYID